jgi:hypothetical protein
MKTLVMLKAAFGELTVGRRWIFGWFSKFKSGLTSVENAECLGPTSVSTRYENMPPEDWQCGKLLTSWEFHVGSVQSILIVNLNVHHIVPYFRPEPLILLYLCMNFWLPTHLIYCDKVLWIMVQLLVSMYKVSRTAMIWM